MTEQRRDQRLAIVTGGAGFIGSHLTENLLARGCRVIVVDNLSTGKRENVPRGVELVEADIASPEFRALLERERPDVVAHLAAQIDVRKSITDPIEDAETNIVALLGMMETIVRSAPKCRVVLTSTAGVYGDAPNPPLSEDVPPAPLSPYAISKLTAERYLEYYARVHGVKSVILRFANVYGPRQDPKGEAGVIAIFCSRIKQGAPLTVFGDGEQTRDYVFVRDVAEGIARASEVPFDAEVAGAPVFNIGTGVATSVLGLVGSLETVSGRRATIEFQPLRPGEIIDSALDASRANERLSWKPGTSLQQGLGLTYEAVAIQA